MKKSADLLKKLLYTEKSKKSKLWANKQYYSTFIDSHRDVSYIFDVDTRKVIETNEAFFTMMKYNAEDVANLYIEDIIVDNLEQIKYNIKKALKSGILDQCIRQYRCKDGSMIFVESKIKVCRMNKKQYIIVTMRDITEYQHMQNQLRLAMQVFNSAIDGIVVTDGEGVIQLANPAFLQNTGYSLDEVMGMSPRILKSGKQDELFYQEMWDSLNETEQWKGELWNKRKNGELYPEWLMINAIKDDFGKVNMYAGVSRDLSERLKYEEQIKHQAYHDGLTDLPNRRSFYQKIHEYVVLARRCQYTMAVMFVDLDGFKSVNDNFGHDIGDLLLIEVGKRLKACIRESDVVARMGGDEFTLILSKINNRQDAALVAIKIQNTLNDSFVLKGYDVKISCSIGISIFPDDDLDEENLIKKADNAMYQAKTEGKNTYRFYRD